MACLKVLIRWFISKLLFIIPQDYGDCFVRSETLLENIEWLKKKGVMGTEETEWEVFCYSK